MIQLKILIIDDEENARELLKIHLSKLTRIEVIGEAKDGKEAVAMITKYKPDLIFLDIEMPELSGLEVLNRLEEIPFVIFVTAFDEYAIQAFEVHAVDYLLKPFTEVRLFKAIHRAEKRIAGDVVDRNLYADLLDSLLNKTEVKYLNRLSVKSNHKTYFIDTATILLIEAADQYVSIQTASDKYLARFSMDYLEKALDPRRFIRSHRSYIVAINHVLSIEKYEPKNLLVHLQGGFKAKLSQSRKTVFEGKLRTG